MASSCLKENGILSKPYLSITGSKVCAKRRVGTGAKGVAIYSMCGWVSIRYSFRPDEAKFEFARRKLVYDIKLILLKQYHRSFSHRYVTSIRFMLCSCPVLFLVAAVFL